MRQEPALCYLGVRREGREIKKGEGETASEKNSGGTESWKTATKRGTNRSTFEVVGEGEPDRERGDAGTGGVSSYHSNWEPARKRGTMKEGLVCFCIEMTGGAETPEGEVQEKKPNKYNWRKKM